jgi:hypothetical protein
MNSEGINPMPLPLPLPFPPVPVVPNSGTRSRSSTLDGIGDWDRQADISGDLITSSSDDDGNSVITVSDLSGFYESDQEEHKNPIEFDEDVLSGLGLGLD